MLWPSRDVYLWSPRRQRSGANPFSSQDFKGQIYKPSKYRPNVAGSATFAKEREIMGINSVRHEGMLTLFVATTRVRLSQQYYLDGFSQACTFVPRHSLPHYQGGLTCGRVAEPISAKIA